VLNPVKNVYAEALPRDVRGCIGNFVSNLASPVVLVNALLQGRFDDAWTVVSRFGINTVLGVYGFGDPAASEFAIIGPLPPSFIILRTSSILVLLPAAAAIRSANLAIVGILSNVFTSVRLSTKWIISSTNPSSQRKP